MQPGGWRPTKRAREAAASEAKRAKELAPTPAPPPPPAPSPQRTPWRLKGQVSKPRAQTVAPAQQVDFAAIVAELVQGEIDAAVRAALDELQCNESLDEPLATMPSEHLPVDDALLELVPHEAQQPDWMESDEYDQGQLH